MTSWLFSSCQKRREGPESPRAVLIAVKKGERIIYVKPLMGETREKLRSVERVAATEQYL
jgi:hypothetical protein